MRSKPSFSANRGFDGAGGPGRFGPTAAAPGATTRRGTRLRTTVVGALLIVAAASAHLAAAPSGPNGAWQENGPRRLDRPAARELASRIGGAWHVETADGSGLPTVVYGTGLDLGRRLDDELAVLEEAFGFLDEHRDFFGLEEIDLDGTPVRAGSLWYLNLGLVRSGVPFDRRSRVDLRLRPEGVLAAVLTHRIPATIESSSPERAASDAARLAVSRTREEPSALDARAEGDPRLEYVVSPVDRTARLAWRVTVAGTRRNTYGTQPLRRDVWIAARGDLAVLDTLDLVHDVDVTGDVIGRGHPFDPRGPLAPIPLRELEVSITETGATTLTDAAGLFTLPNPGTDPVTVVAELRGSYVDVNTRDGGEDLRYEKVNTPGNPVAIRFHTAPDPGDPRQAAQVDGYVHTNIVRDYLRARLPLSGLDDPIDCNVNVTTSSCNAFYTGGTINFYTEGDNCVNMAFDTIVYHEYGHYLDDLAGGILDRALTEGLADVIAVYASGQPLVGENYRFGSDYLRTAENDRVWPANECGNRPHCIGESFSGFCWDARTELVRSLGDTEGVRVAEEIVLSSILGNAINIPRAVLEVFLQDDDDGNLANRTPHFRELGKAAVRHGFDPPTVEVIRFTHVERPFAVGDPINDLEIEFGMEAFAGPVANPTLLYSIDNASTFEEVPMQPGSEPGVFTASVPRQDVGAWIKYYARAEDALGNVRTAPTGAPPSTGW